MPKKKRKIKRGQKAGNIVLPCGRLASSLPEPKKPPCDIASISVTLSTPLGTISKTNSKKVASVTPLPDVNSEINQLLARHAVVIHHVTTPVKAGAAPLSRVNDVHAQNVGKAKGSTSLAVAMKANCGSHPVVTRDPAPKKGDNDTKKKELSAETKEWTVTEFLKTLWGGGRFRDFVCPETDEVTFTASTCGRPASGDPLTELSGVTRVVLADEWRGEFRWSEGFKLSFSETSTHGKGFRDGTKSGSGSRSVTVGDKTTSSSSEWVEKDGKTLSASAENKTKTGDKTDSESSWGVDAPNQSGSIEADLKTWKSTELSAEVSEKFKKAQAKAEKIKQGFSVSLSRNGKALFDTSTLGEVITQIEDTLKIASDLLYRLVWLLESTAKMGIPVSLTFAIKLSATFLKANNYLRFWPEPLPPKQSGAYYIEDMRTRFQFGVDVTAVEISVTPTITLQAKVVHEVIAAVTIEVEGKIQGSAKLGYSVTDGMAASDFRFVGQIRTSVKGSGEASAASFYIKIEGEVSSGIRYIYSVGFDGERMKNQHQQVTSDELAFSASFRWGNKIWDYIGLGSDEPDYQWPSDGKFVWLKDNALNEEW